MAVCVVVDVEGTFTKTVAVDLEVAIVAESVLPTTHDAEEGVAAGVVQCVATSPRSSAPIRSSSSRIRRPRRSTPARGRRGHGRHRRDGTAFRARQGPRRTALLEGPSWRREAPRHTVVLLDVTDGLDAPATAAAAARSARRRRLGHRDREPFAPVDASNEHGRRRSPPSRPPLVHVDRPVRLVRARAPHGDGHDQRVDHADRAAHASHVEEHGVAAGIDAADHRHAGDGGATDLAGFQAGPCAHALQDRQPRCRRAPVHGAARYGIVVEVRGTSTNVAGVKLGRPSLPDVTVALARDRARRAARRRAGDRRRRWLDAARQAAGRWGRRATLRATSPGSPTPASPTPRSSRPAHPVTSSRAPVIPSLLVLKLSQQFTHLYHHHMRRDTLSTSHANDYCSATQRRSSRWSITETPRRPRRRQAGAGGCSSTAARACVAHDHGDRVRSASRPRSSSPSAAAQQAQAASPEMIGCHASCPTAPR